MLGLLFFVGCHFREVLGTEVLVRDVLDVRLLLDIGLLLSFRARLLGSGVQVWVPGLAGLLLLSGARLLGLGARLGLGLWSRGAVEQWRRGAGAVKLKGAMEPWGWGCEA